MTYLKRKIDTFLTSWKQDPEHLPLIVKGPRQVGKTEAILHFAHQNYQNVITINFVEEPKYRSICADGYRAGDIARNISLLDPSKTFVPDQTLIFFDELQECPDIATSLKFFCEDGRFDVICSGSMLGISYAQIESNSVGYKIDYEMHSLDFEEFLWACGYQDSIRETVLSHIQDVQPFSTTEMQVFSKVFQDYCILGGMPAVVRRFVENQTFEASLAIQKQLILDYEEDIQKYAEGLDKARILNVFRSLPIQLAKENKKFQLSKVAKGARFKDYRGCIEWLETAGMVQVCRCLNFPELPLKGNYQDNKYKLYFADNGLFVAMLDDEASDDLRVNKNFNVYKGAMYESIVAEALVKQGYSLYYYKRDNSTLEEDFFIRTYTDLVPVEVKSSTGRSKSLRTLIESATYPDITWGIKLHAGNIGYENNIFSMPYFCAFLLRESLAAVPKPADRASKQRE